MARIHPVLLAGGSGTRLWPVSRRGYPKQFSSFAGPDTLFQAAVRRVSRPEYAPALIVTGSDFRFLVTEQLREAGLSWGDVLIEPARRNTAPAVLAAALWLARSRPDALMLVAPSDHDIPDADAFAAAVAAGAGPAQSGRIVTFGIPPTRPETGYGYIEAAPASGNGARPVLRFVEKPDADRAAAMLAEGRYLWNAGIFLMRADTLVAAFDAHAPDFVPPVRSAVEAAQPDLDFHRLEPEAWARLPDLSIDHAIMERADNLVVMPFDGAWSDLGDWNAVSRVGDADAEGNALSGAVTALGCRGSVLRSGPDGPRVVGLGLRDALVVATEDAVLVTDRANAQMVGRAVTALQEAGADEATAFAWDHRPWGSYTVLAQGARFQVKRIRVKPGGVLSLQSHHHRSEHWVVVEGTARVTLNDDVRLLSENESVYIPLGARHRLENPGKMPVVLIEVQTGAYLGEDDIQRYEDIYARQPGD